MLPVGIPEEDGWQYIAIKRHQKLRHPDGMPQFPYQIDSLPAGVSIVLLPYWGFTHFPCP